MSNNAPRPEVSSLLPDTYMDPVELFQAYFARAQATEARDEHGIGGANQVALATVGADGQPSVRIVLLKGADARGFVFFTNYESRKGRQLQERGRAGLCFYWPALAVQIRIEGEVAKIDAAESDAYFASRARLSQLAAWASAQSEPLASRAELDRRYEETEARFDGGPVPRPPYWGGYCVRPARIEFWEGSRYRMHDRLAFTRDEAAPHGWRMERLYP